MKRIIFFLVIFSLQAAVASADTNGGSMYSRYGLGDLQYFLTSRAEGMGGAGLSILSPNALDRLNPAGWARITRTRFEVGALYERFNTSDASSSASLVNTQFDGFAVGLPLSPEHGLTVSFGITPFSRMQYNVVTPGVVDNGFAYDAQYIGDGTLSTGEVGSSYSIFSDLHVGMKLQYYFGTLRYTTRQTFSAGNYTSSEVTRADQLRGLGGAFGIIYSGIQRLLGVSQANTISVGGYISLPTTLKSTIERTYLFTPSPTLPTRDTLTSPQGFAKIPLSAGGGISYANERILAAADLLYQNWKSFDASDISSDVIRDSYRFGAGVEFLPHREPGSTFSQRTAYRFGGYYLASYYRLRGEPINEIGGTAGLGIPVIGDTRIDIGVSYGIRGTTDSQLQKDKILRISFTLSGGELWFIRPPEE